MPTNEYKYADEQGLSALSEEIFQKVKYHVDPDEHTVTAGNSITFETASAQMAKNVKVGFEPVQDLHGYDHPWPAGGGKNLLPMTVAGIKAANTGGTWSGNTYAHPSEISFSIITDNNNNVIGIKANGTASGGALFGLASVSSGNYLINGSTGGGSGTFGLRIGTGSSSTLVGRQYDGTDYVYNASDIVDLSVYVMEGTTVTNTMFYPMIRLATETDSTFEPYSNICPISGIESLAIKACGKNLAVAKNAVGTRFSNYGMTGVINDDLSITVSGTSNNNAFVHFAELTRMTLPAGSYIFNGQNDVNPSNKKLTLQLYNNEITDQIVNKDDGADYAFTLTKDTDISIFVGVRSGCSVTNVVMKPMIRFASITDSAYEPYHGTEVTSDLPSTIYSGELDLESGELVCDMGIVDLGSLGWNANGSFGSNYEYAYDLSGKASGVVNMLCSSLAVQQSTALNCIRGRAANNTISVVSLITTASAFKTAMSGVQLVYELATPITYQLTPQQLALFRGINTVSTNASKIRVTYRNGKIALMDDVPQTLAIEEAKTDAKLKQVLGNFAPVEETNVASTNYAIGSPVVVGTVLRKITSAVAANETIDSTNSAAITIAELFSSIVDANNVSY